MLSESINPNTNQSINMFLNVSFRNPKNTESKGLPCNDEQEKIGLVIFYFTLI